MAVPARRWVVTCWGLSMAALAGALSCNFTKDLETYCAESGRCATEGADPSDAGPDGCTPIAWYRDLDTDSYGDPASTPILRCTKPAGYVANDLDCLDTATNVNPEAAESCANSIDDNCNEQANEGCGPCVAENDACGPGLDCCGGLVCASGSCARPPCSGPNASCAVASCCKGLVCNAGQICQSPPCASSGQSCASIACCMDMGLSCDANSICSTSTSCSGEGGSCASSNCCAGLVCDPNFVCVPPAACSPQGQSCAAATCCAGLFCNPNFLCEVPCSTLGQSCATASCCSGLSCVGSFCQQSCVGDGGSCVAADGGLAPICCGGLLCSGGSCGPPICTDGGGACSG